MKRSRLWSYFQKEGSIAVCTICKKQVKTSGNISNLAAHMKQHKIEEDPLQRKIMCCPKPSTSTASTAGTASVKDNLDAFESVEENQELQKQELGKQCNVKEAKSPNIPKITKAFDNISQYSKGGTKYNRITDALAYFICVDNRPFNTVEGKGFQYLMKQVAPLYKVPSREIIKTNIDKKFEKISKIVKDKFKNVKDFCITTDVWTETMTNTGFLGATVHFLLGKDLQAIKVGVFELDESHTGEYIGQQLTAILENWSIDSEKVVAFVTDSGANMVKCIRETFGAGKHIPCFAHMINLVADDALKKTSELCDLLDHVRNIVKYTKRRQEATTDLKRKQMKNNVSEGKTLKVILDVKTRWNSTYYMLQRFLELAPYISEIIFAKFDAPTMLTGVQLSTLKDVAHVMRLLEAMTKESSADHYVTISKVIPMISCAIDQYKIMVVTSTIADELKRNVTNEMEKRFGQLEYSSLLAVSTILDPRFKNLHFKKPDACAKAMTKIRKMITENMQVASVSSTSSEDEGTEFDFWQYHKSLAHTQIKRKKSEGDDELTLYMAAPVATLKTNVLETWQEMQGSYPNLYKIAMRHFPIVATSVPSERLFSKAGATVTQARNRLHGKRLAKLLFLGSIDAKYWQL